MKHLKHVLIALSAVACQAENGSEVTHNASPQAADEAPGTPDAGAGETQLATFAGGCFWCMETPFEDLDGVSAVISGYTGGNVDNPTYKQVCAGTTGHTEAIQIHFDPERVSYADLLEIFYHDDAQREAAEASKRALAESGRFDEPIVTAITAFERYWEAEEYHQDFYLKSPDRYYSYRKGSGRDRFLDRTWGADREYVPQGGAASKANASAWRSYEKEPDSELRERLTELQYRVTQREGTERPFKNEFWDNKKEGIYVDIVSGEPLFSSSDKFKSGTGWPSFTRPLVDANIATKTDHKLGYARTEVRSAIADSHLGHVFKDGPAPTGLRYCINSAALRFVPKADLEREGYGEFAKALQP